VEVYLLDHCEAAEAKAGTRPRPRTPGLGQSNYRSADAALAHIGVDDASGSYVDGPGAFFAASRSAIRSAWPLPA
jgi:hypothetical protein